MTAATCAFIAALASEAMTFLVIIFEMRRRHELEIKAYKELLRFYKEEQPDV